MRSGLRDYLEHLGGKERLEGCPKCVSSAYMWFWWQSHPNAATSVKNDEHVFWTGNNTSSHAVSLIKGIFELFPNIYILTQCQTYSHTIWHINFFRNKLHNDHLYYSSSNLNLSLVARGWPGEIPITLQKSAASKRGIPYSLIASTNSVLCSPALWRAVR